MQDAGDARRVRSGKTLQSPPWHGMFLPIWGKWPMLGAAFFFFFFFFSRAHDAFRPGARDRRGRRHPRARRLQTTRLDTYGSARFHIFPDALTPARHWPRTSAASRQFLPRARRDIDIERPCALTIRLHTYYYMRRAIYSPLARRMAEETRYFFIDDAPLMLPLEAPLPCGTVLPHAAKD